MNSKSLAAKELRRKKWRRRLIIVLSIFVIGVIAVRSLVPVLLPPVMRSVAGRYGLNAEYDKLEFYLLGGDVGFWNLRFTTKNTGDEVLQVDYCRGSVSTLGLLRGKLFVQRAEAEGADVYVSREADGSIPLLKQFLDAPVTAEPAATSPTSIPIESPLAIKALRLQHAVAHLTDRGVTPATSLQFTLNMMLNDVGSPDEPTKYSIQLNSPEMLGALYIDGSGVARDRQIKADVKIRMLGLNALAAKPYLAAFGITPVAAEMSASGTGSLIAIPAPPRPSDPAEAPVRALSAKIDFNDFVLTNNSSPSASLKSLKIDAPVVAPGEVRVASVLVEGVHVTAWRDAEGHIGVAGLSLGAPTPVASSTTQPVVVPTTAPSNSSLPIFELSALQAKDVQLVFDDAGLTPATKLALNVSNFKLTNISTDPEQSRRRAVLRIDASSPENVRAITVDGVVALGEALKTAELSVSASGISGAGLDPYFSRLGITRALNDASFNSRVTGKMQVAPDKSATIAFKVADVTFTDASNQWFAAPGLELTKLSVNADASRIGIEAIDIAGPQFNVRRGSNGKITALGLTFDPNADISGIGPISFNKPTTAQPATTKATSSSTISLPAISIDSFHWGGVAIGIDDETFKPAVSAPISDVDVKVTKFSFDPNSTESRPGEIRIAATLPGNLERFVLNGKVAAQKGSLAIEAKGEAAGLTLEKVKPILATFGVTPTLADGSVSFAAAGSLKKNADAVAADFALKDLKYIDGTKSWFTLGRFSIDGASFASKQLDIANISVDQPQLLVQRDISGTFALLGARIEAPPAVKSNAAQQSTAAPTTAPTAALPIKAAIKSLKLTGGRLDFDDQSVRPAVKLNPTLDASLEQLVIGSPKSPARFSGTLRAKGLVETLNFNGNLLADIPKQSASVNVTTTGSGLSGSALLGYLPAGVINSSDSGDLKASLIATVAPNAAGGFAISAGANNVLIDDHLAADPALSLKSALIKIDRLDPAAKIVAIDEINVTDFSARAIQDDRGFVLPIVVIGAKTPADRGPATKPAEQQANQAAGASLQDIIKQNQEKPALITLKRLSLNAGRLAVQTNGMTRPVALRNVYLWNATPIELLGDDPAQRPPFDLKLSASIEQFVRSITATSRLAPFAAEPTARLSIDVIGISGKELVSVVPALDGVISGNDLDNGSFHTDVESQFAFTRRGLFGIDVSRDITASFNVKNTLFTQPGRDSPFVAVQEVRGEKARLSVPKASLAIQTIDIVKPTARVLRDPSGIHVIGLTIADPTQAKSATTQPAIEVPTTKPTEASPVAQVQPATTSEPSLEQKSGGDFRIDSLTVSGIDLAIEDRVTEPFTIIPVNDLELEVKGINTRALTEPLPIRFNMLASAGKAQLPVKNPKTAGETEARDVFSQLTASGKLNIYPKPDGWVKLSLSGFDLTAVRGVAKEQGITLGGGTFDFAADVRMQGADTFEAKLTPTLNDLKVSEQGPSKILKFFGVAEFPVPPGMNPLDAAIFAVQGADGSITLPVKAPMKAGQLDMGTIIGSAAGAVGGQITVGIATLPAKLAAAAFGLDFKAGKDKDLQPIAFAYPAGESLMSAEQVKQIDELVKRMKSDATLQVQIVHALASADAVLAQQRANPSKDDATQIAKRLRAAKLDLQHESIELGSTLRVALASQNKLLTDQTQAKLQQTTADLAQTEAALDEMLNLLRPGAEKQADRRTKAASVELGQQRIASVRRLLRDPAIPDIDQRLILGKPLPTPVDGQAQGTITLVLSRRAKS